MGDDIRVPIVGDTDEKGVYDLKLNSGSGKRHPGGPSGRFRGKDVPCLVGASPKGSITPELLVSALDHFDELGLFPRGDGVTPCFLCDSHGSRFSLEFLRRVNDEDWPYNG